MTPAYDRSIFERSRAGAGAPVAACPTCRSRDVPGARCASGRRRELPEVSEPTSSATSRRCRAELRRRHGFYPLGSCTMKYNPKINEGMAALPGFAPAPAPARATPRARSS